MTAQGTARKAANSDALEHLARIGLIALQLVHLLVARWRRSWPGSAVEESADQSGAMATVAESPVGKPLLWVLALGLIALAVWQAAEVFRWRSGWSASRRARRRCASPQRAGQGRPLRGPGGAGDPLRHRRPEVELAVAADDGRRLRLAGRAVPGRARRAGAHRRRRLARAQGFGKHFLKQIDTTGASPKAVRLVTRLGQIGFPARA